MTLRHPFLKCNIDSPNRHARDHWFRFGNSPDALLGYRVRVPAFVLKIRAVRCLECQRQDRLLPPGFWSNLAIRGLRGSEVVRNGEDILDEEGNVIGVDHGGLLPQSFLDDHEYDWSDSYFGIRPGHLKSWQPDDDYDVNGLALTPAVNGLPLGQQYRS